MVGRVWAGLTAYTNTKQKINSPGLGRTARGETGPQRVTPVELRAFRIAPDSKGRLDRER